jgi:hypothetical protein
VPLFAKLIHNFGSNASATADHYHFHACLSCYAARN